MEPVSIVDNRTGFETEGPCPPKQTILYATRKVSIKVLSQYDSFKCLLTGGPSARNRGLPGPMPTTSRTVLPKRKKDLKLVPSTNILKQDTSSKFTLLQRCGMGSHYRIWENDACDSCNKWAPPEGQGL